MKNKPGIQDMALQYGDKVLFGVALLLMCYFAVGGATLTPLSWQPDTLTQSANNASQRIETNNVTPADLDLKIRDYGEFAKGIKVGVKPSMYLTDKMWESSLFAERNKRGPVELLPITKLQASTGIGAVLTIPTRPTRTTFDTATTGMTSAAGAELTGKRWVSLVGLIPIEEQLERYLESYGNAIYSDPARDTPLYAYYRVERRDSTTPNAPWLDINAYNSLVAETKKWAAVAPEQVDPAYLAPTVQAPMAYPLAMLAKGVYGEGVAFPPDVPMMSDVLLKQVADQAKLQQEFENLPTASLDEMLKADPFARMRATGGGGAGGRFGMGSSSDGGMGGFSGSSGGGGATPFTTQRTINDSFMQTLEQSQQPIKVSHYLFRFFDFNVQPGKSYQYRVSLILVNPNYRLEEQFVENTRLTIDPYVYTAASDASPWVTVPTDTRVLMTGVTAPARPGQEPTASLMSIYFDMKDSTEWVYDANRLNRGMMVNFDNRAGRTAEQTGTVATDTSSTNEGTSTRPAARPKLPTRTANFDANVCLLDMTGGVRLAGNQVSPGKVLVMEPSGIIAVREVDRDTIEGARYKAPEATPANRTSSDM